MTTEALVGAVAIRADGSRILLPISEVLRREQSDYAHTFTEPLVKLAQATYEKLKPQGCSIAALPVLKRAMPEGHTASVKRRSKRKGGRFKSWAVPWHNHGKNYNKLPK